MRTHTDADVQSARSRAVQRVISSSVLGRDVPYTLLLPHDLNTGRRFSTLYLLHGRGDDDRSWNANTTVSAFVQNLPLIVVMPDAKQSRYINSVGGGRYQDFFLDELVAHIDSTLPTIAERTGRATAGLSMGGYGAWRLALLAADRFAAAVAMSGSLNWGEADPSFETYRALITHLYGGTGAAELQQYAAHAIWPLIERHRGPTGWTGPALAHACGWDDRHFDFNREIHQRLSAARIPHTWTEAPGGHEWTFWEIQVRLAIVFAMLHVQT